MKQRATVNGNPFPFLTVLGLIFITLKLTGSITWSWWWVLAPFWIPTASVVFIISCLWAGGIIAEIVNKVRK